MKDPERSCHFSAIIVSQTRDRCPWQLTTHHSISIGSIHGTYWVEGCMMRWSQTPYLLLRAVGLRSSEKHRRELWAVVANFLKIVQQLPSLPSDLYRLLFLMPNDINLPLQKIEPAGSSARFFGADSRDKTGDITSCYKETMYRQNFINARQQSWFERVSWYVYTSRFDNKHSRYFTKNEGKDLKEYTFTEP